ncbi:hypothetical protein C1H46_018510 [Malus baccata]|uniref:Uncharacterized protein n=1 Tax=Malus baccata TaxID=106549 RepID=A0A540MBD9_MALBA|nr:hypothetical protein C1H46_018510 [Malus baccata]
MPVSQEVVRCGSREPIESSTSRTSLWLSKEWDMEKHGRENWAGEKWENDEKRRELAKDAGKISHNLTI